MHSNRPDEAGMRGEGGGDGGSNVMRSESESGSEEGEMRDSNRARSLGHLAGPRCTTWSAPMAWRRCEPLPVEKEAGRRGCSREGMYKWASEEGKALRML